MDTNSLFVVMRHVCDYDASDDIAFVFTDPVQARTKFDAMCMTECRKYPSDGVSIFIKSCKLGTNIIDEGDIITDWSPPSPGAHWAQVTKFAAKARKLAKKGISFTYLNAGR
jgi:hypothetical protein